MNRLATAKSALLEWAYGLRAQFSTDDSERGDVPGWVLVTLMTAGLVTLLWQTAGPILQRMLKTALAQVSG